MKMILSVVAVALASTLGVDPAHGWASANRYGGSTTHSYGSTSHTNAYGGSSSHEAGEGTEHTNTYGGSTAHSAYGGTEHTNVYGGTTARAYGPGAYRTYPSGATYCHPPTYPSITRRSAVPYYSTSCYRCAAAAGADWSRCRRGGSFRQRRRGDIERVCRRCGNRQRERGGRLQRRRCHWRRRGSAPASGAYVMSVNYAALPAGAIVIDERGDVLPERQYLVQPSYGANGVYTGSAGSLMGRDRTRTTTTSTIRKR